MNKYFPLHARWRLIFFITATLICLNAIILINVQTAIRNFREKEIEKDMTRMANSIHYFCNTAHNWLSRTGTEGDKIQVRLKQTEALEMIEDFVRNSDFSILVYDRSVDQVSPILSSRHGAKDHIILAQLPPGRIDLLQIGDIQYSLQATSFDSWNWTIVLLKASTAYDTLFSRLNTSYLFIGLLICQLAIGSFIHFHYQRKSKKALSESRADLRATLDSLTEGVIVVDRKGHITRMNISAYMLTGWDCDQDLTGKHVWEVLELYTPYDKTRLDRDVYTNLGKAPLTGADPKEFLLVARDGTTKLVEIRTDHSTTYAHLNHRNALVLSITDITRQKTTEKRLQQAQKMEAIGLMAGGVAHDLNNILSSIINYPELILFDLPKDSEFYPFIVAIQESGIRAAAIVADLLTVARGAASTREPVQINHLIKSYIRSPEFLQLKNKFPDISFPLDLDDALPMISCSEIHVRKCLMNLLINSAEAISGKGCCGISTRLETITRDSDVGSQINPGPYVRITIWDDGPGIKKEDMGHIFEPFYTKKKMGASGTGLGLTIVWNTMEDHGGIVNLTSSSEGSQFDLYFPAHHAVSDSMEVIADWTIKDIMGNGETILIVDDEPRQRDIAAKFLERLNYQSVVAASGEDAVAYLQTHQVDLVLLDMIMEPGMNGYETFKAIKKIHPKQKALVVSGYSESRDVKNTLALGCSGFLKKPYLRDEFGKAVHTALNSDDSGVI